MSFVITGGMYDGNSYSCMFDPHERYDMLSSNQKYYYQFGILEGTEQNCDKSAILAFSMDDGTVLPDKFANVELSEADRKDLIFEIESKIPEMFLDTAKSVEETHKQRVAQAESIISNVVSNAFDCEYE